MSNFIFKLNHPSRRTSQISNSDLPNGDVNKDTLDHTRVQKAAYVRMCMKMGKKILCFYYIDSTF